MIKKIKAVLSKIFEFFKKIFTDDYYLGEHAARMLVMHVETLEPIEKKVIIRRFGLKDGIGRTPEEIAKELDLLTPKAVLEYEESAYKKMRDPTRIKELWDSI